jgi:hypothetical protein
MYGTLGPMCSHCGVGVVVPVQVSDLHSNAAEVNLQVVMPTTGVLDVIPVTSGGFDIVPVTTNAVTGGKDESRDKVASRTRSKD